MKNTFAFILLSILSFFLSKINAQDVTFTQWENIPVYFNPALTGDFDGLVRIRAKHRNTFRSLLRQNSYQAYVASAEYKLKSSDKRQFGFGFHALSDKAGASCFKTETYNLSSSIVQNLNSRHSIALGFTAGLGKRSINIDSLRWGSPEPEPIDITSKVNFADIAVGLNWRYVTDNHFAFHLGSALMHVNRPNTSFSQNGNSKLSPRFNLHGNVEIPVFNKFSIVPSFLYVQQYSSGQLLFGFFNKWYPKSSQSNFVQIGAFAKNANHFDGTAIDIFVLSASMELNGILLGFAFDRFQRIGSNAYEISLGYTIGN